MQKSVRLGQDSFKQVMLHEAKVVKLWSFSKTSGSAAFSTNPTCSFSSATNNWGHSLMGSKGLQHLTLHYRILNSAEIVFLALRFHKASLLQVISERVKEAANR